MIIDNYFRELRFNESHHLGMGDIRLTMGQQDFICQMFNAKKEEDMKGNIYHSGSEESVDCIKFRIAEMEQEENQNKENHLTYQSLLKFFYDTRNIINT
jgi:hypothetical protein